MNNAKPVPKFKFDPNDKHRASHLLSSHRGILNDFEKTFLFSIVSKDMISGGQLEKLNEIHDQVIARVAKTAEEKK